MSKPKKTKKSPAEILEKIKSFVLNYLQYSWLIFSIFLIILYVSLILGVNNDLSVSASQPPLTAQTLNATRSQTLVINQSILNKLQQLNNNSVTVQSLFNQNRNNPF